MGYFKRIMSVTQTVHNKMTFSKVAKPYIVYLIPWQLAITDFHQIVDDT